MSRETREEDDPGDRGDPGEEEEIHFAKPKSASPLWRPALLIVALVVLFVAARAFDLGQRVGELRAWIDSLGPWGPLAFIGLYVLATIAMIPGSGPTVLAGGLFGSIWGTVYVSLASTTGAAACFLIARYVARGPVAEWLEGQERFRKLDRLTETHGSWIVAITRLVPVFPFNLLNYGFGLTRVPFWTYVFFSWLCMLPGTVLYVAGADTIVRGIEQGRVPWTMIGLLVLLFATLLGLGLFARRKLRAAEREAGVQPD